MSRAALRLIHIASRSSPSVIHLPVCRSVGMQVRLRSWAHSQSRSLSSWPWTASSVAKEQVPDLHVRDETAFSPPVDTAIIVSKEGASSTYSTTASEVGSATVIAGDSAGITDATDVLSAVANTPELTTELTRSWSDVFVQPAVTFVTSVHDITGLSWWATIIVCTIGIRTLLLPVSLFTMRNAARMSAVQEDVKLIRDEAMAAIRSGNSNLAHQKQQQQREFMRSAGINPFKVFLGPLVQFPVFISLFVSIRRIASTNPEMTTGGVAWFVDLSSKDPTFLLPILAGLTLGVMTELGGDTGAKMTAPMKKVMRLMCVASIPLTYWFPSAVFFYWIPNNIFSILLSSGAKVPFVRNAVGLNIDLSKVQGTKAALEAAKLSRSKAEPVDAQAAAASYLRKQGLIADSNVVKNVSKAVSMTDSKPVLYKSKKDARDAKLLNSRA